MLRSEILRHSTCFQCLGLMHQLGLSHFPRYGGLTKCSMFAFRSTPAVMLRGPPRLGMITMNWPTYSSDFNTFHHKLEQVRLPNEEVSLLCAKFVL
ncbi:hypothetical protein TNCT_658901 [Trichonephila clavata]|uniref:Uncharacterized protein n=1 Tax=Trichonephila clavata TaxID=2740835 RepID=A0A8X6HLD8_TRICU|nr:hypothetical protein TNCT_658901 [Trichonephila clavata]